MLKEERTGRELHPWTRKMIAERIDAAHASTGRHPTRRPWWLRMIGPKIYGARWYQQMSERAYAGRVRQENVVVGRYAEKQARKEQKTRVLLATKEETEEMLGSTDDKQIAGGEEVELCS